MIDREQIYKWWSIFHSDNDVTEIRSLGSATYSGYYKNIDNAIRDIEYLSNKSEQQIYFIINAIDEACYGREQREKIVFKPKHTTSDNEIIGRKWLMIDLDPKRVSGTNSSKDELEFAHRKAIDIYKFLKSNGFYDPVVCMSGNGYHLLYSCRLAISKETDNIVTRFISVLSMLFTDEHVDVDKQCDNRSRLSKVYGTIARKGSDTDDRPCRTSRIIKVPEEIKVNDIEYIKKVADLYPEDKPQPSSDNHWGTKKFDVEAFLQKHNLNYKKESVSDGTKYILDHCVFNENHKGKDAVIFQRDNGALAYVCLHNSCSHYGWKDFRLKFDPNAYDKKDYKEFQYKQRQYQPIIKQPFVVKEENKEDGKKWLSMTDIKRVDITEMMSIPTGYTELDRKIVGLFAGELTVLSGLNASGKTSWLDCVALNAVQRGYKVAIWSGEMQDWRFLSWIDQIAAGKNYVVKKEGYDNLYYAPKKYCEKINKWLGDKLYLYNNEYGSKWEQLFSDIKDIVEEKGINLVILDNLAALNINGLDGDKYAKQTNFIIDLKDYAKAKNIHVILVCHPRKQDGFLRKESISGTADLTNIADGVGIIHRVGRDFEVRAGEFFGQDVVSRYLDYSAVMEVCKNRDFGITDYLVGMYFEPESRRLKNDIAEHIVYGWEEQDSNAYTNASFEDTIGDMPDFL